MNVTKNEFEKKVRANHPAKWIDFHVNSMGIEWIFTLDTYGETLKSPNDKYTIASHVWTSLTPGSLFGDVVKDSYGDFSPLVTNPQFTTGSGILTITFPTYVTAHINCDGVIPPSRTTKCTCGCAKIGSNSHSDWCDVKENS